MGFQPQIGQEIIIEQSIYRVAEHPAAPGVPFGQEGRTAVVYRLDAGDSAKALKVFKSRYRTPALVGLAQKLASYADLPGLAVCRRTVLTPQHHGALLRRYPDLTYAVLMPWIEGPTWTEVLLGRETQWRQGITPEQALRLAGALATILAEMEQKGVAHCDLSGPNVLLPALLSHSNGQHEAVSLVDVEQLYGPGLEQPPSMPESSPGYRHRTTRDGVWSEVGDRYAGALLLAEMLGWCDERIRRAAWGEHYFDPGEMQTTSERYRLLVTVVQERWGTQVVGLIERAWRSETLADCPTFGEWLLTLPSASGGDSPAHGYTLSTDPVELLLLRAQKEERAGDMEKALSFYEEALRATASPALRDELHHIIDQIRRHQQERRRLAETAQAHMRAGRWTEAAAAYEALLREKGDPRQEQAWRTALATCREELDLQGLFTAAEQALRENRWQAAVELLSAIVTRRPNYSYRGQRAQDLKKTAERELAKAAKQPVTSSTGRKLLQFVFLLALIGGLGYGGWYAYGWWQISNYQRMAATATALAVPWVTATAHAERTAEALATQQAAATRSAEATLSALATERAVLTVQAGQTATAVAAERATVTAQAEATATAIAAERATMTAQVRATQTAVARSATSTAQAKARAATATAQAEAQAATATAVARATEQAEAQARAAAQTATAVARARQRPGLVLDFEEDIAWRRGDQPYGQLDRSGEQVRAGSYAARLRYDFPAVFDNFVVFTARPAVNIPGQPTGITAWVYGDGSGHFLNAWIQDAAGEIRSYTFGQIRHLGWQPMTAWFDEGRGWPNGHIGGPDDGRLTFPVKLYALVLDGVPDGQGSGGVIYLDEIFATTEPIPQPTPPPPPPPGPPPSTTSSALLPRPPQRSEIAHLGGVLSLGMLLGLVLLVDHPAGARRHRRGKSR